MKFAIIDQQAHEWNEEVFDSEEAAISRADYEWGIMAASDKKRRDAYYVAACELNEDGCVDYDTITDIIKEYK